MKRDPFGEGRDDHFLMNNQDGGCELDRHHCETEDQENWRLLGAQQNREAETSKVRCDQINNEKATEVIEEELPIAEHTMDSPRTESDRRMRIS
eukprot:1483930-Heterocapsa_arctica.AAC.1